MIISIILDISSSMIVGSSSMIVIGWMVGYWCRIKGWLWTM